MKSTFAYVCFAEKMWVSWHCLRTHKSHPNTDFNINLGLTILFTHLKIILLQYFQFLAINGIQTDP